MSEPGRSVAFRIRLLLAALSGLCLAMPFVVPGTWLIGWVALVPLLVALDGPGITFPRAWLLGCVAGLALAVVASSWAPGFVARLKGYGSILAWLSAGGLWFYTAQVLALFALAMHLTRQSRISVVWRTAVWLALVFLVFPAQFRIRPGESQAEFLLAIQGVSLFGVHGLDVMMGLVNGLVFSLMRRTGERYSRVGAVVLLALWLGFGVSRFFPETQPRLSDTLRAGLVQPDQPPVRDEPDAATGFTHGYPPAMALSRDLAQAGAQLLLWPEVRFNPYYREPGLGAAYRRQVAEMGVPVLFQSMEVDASGREYNVAVYLDSRGEPRQSYRKVNLVPLGERLPRIPLLEGFLERWLGDFLDEVTAGSEPVNITQANGPVLVPLICYDVMFPGFVARAARTAPGGILVALSNNAWFGDSSLPRQHLGASVLRAVENRMPMIHVMNNGPSAVISARGKYLFRSGYGERVGYLVDVPVPERRLATFYQVVPWFTPAVLLTCGILLVLATLTGRPVSGSGYKSLRWMIQPSRSQPRHGPVNRSAASLSSLSWNSHQAVDIPR